MKSFASAVTEHKLVAKHEFDPMGLMNPGKMIGFKPTAAPQPAAA